MARIDLPLPAKDADYDSRKSRAILTNMMVEINRDGTFKSITRREGALFGATTPNLDNLISNISFEESGPRISGATNLYLIVFSFGTSPEVTFTDLGAHGIVTSADDRITLAANNDNPRQYVLGHGSTSTTFKGGVFTPITDTDFTSKNPGSAIHLLSRFYFVDGSSNSSVQFFASAVLNGTTYDPLAFASADEETGELFRIVSYKSSLWAFCSFNIELWQTFNDPTFPLRRIIGASKRIGIYGARSLDNLYDYIGFVGSDLRVYMITGTDIKMISDLDFSNRIDSLNDRNIFFIDCAFIDGPNHRYFSVTVESNDGFGDIRVDFTWVYDLKTGQSHYRETAGLTYWNLKEAAYMKSTGKNLTVYSVEELGVPDASRDLFVLQPGEFQDNGVNFTCIVQSASISFENDIIIEYIEIEMETGVGNVLSPNPVMTIEYSKDGGETFIPWGTVELGAAGEGDNRIRMNSFGRLVRHRDFILKMTCSDPVRFEIYGAYLQIFSGL